MAVPFLDLSRQVAPLTEAFLAEARAVLESGRFVKGPRCAAFEAAWAEACGGGEAVAVTNGTAALELALRVAGVGPCDEVILPAMTFGATANAVLAVGARPVLADIDPETSLIKLTEVVGALSLRTKAVIPVHLYGRTVDVNKLRGLLRDEITIVEDSAQAQLAPGPRGGLAGQLGGDSDLGCFSFFPTKNLGCCGDAGALVTRDPERAERARRLRDHGRSAPHRFEEPGSNLRLDELKAAWLSLSLPLLAQRNAERLALAARYHEALADLGWLERPPLEPASVWHLYVVRTPERDRLRQHLTAADIGSGLHYPQPIHHQPAFAPYFAGESYPHAEMLADRGLSLPLFPGMTEGEQDEVVAAVHSFRP